MSVSAPTIFEEISPEIRILCAFLEPVTRRGFATEWGQALLDASGRPTMLAGVDAPNKASIRVLEKLGFAPDGSMRGEFDELCLFRWRLALAMPART